MLCARHRKNRLWRWLAGVAIIAGLLLLIDVTHTKLRQEDIGIDVQSRYVLQQHLNDARAAHQPVLVYFHADWCRACAQMRSAVFLESHVEDRLHSFVVLSVNMTTPSVAVQALLQTFHIIAPPAIIFFDAQGLLLTNSTIVGEITAQQFLEQLDRVQRNKKSH